MNISSVIVIPRPEQVEQVLGLLRELQNVEVAAVSPEGKIIVTIEADGDRETVQIYEQISLMQGVMSASMVYHQKEDQPETEIFVDA
jgi:nitrate reductase NapD